MQEGGFPVFKGLQKPYEFMGIRGRYLTWLGIAILVSIISFFGLYVTIGGVVATVVFLVIVSASAGFIFIKQKDGLHSKKKQKGVFIYHHLFIK